jgi:DNA-binding NtrC family response regulator
MGRPHILVIDDETELRAAIAQALTLDGYDVETALDGREGATLVCRHPYDLIFCDHAGDGWAGALRGDPAAVSPRAQAPGVCDGPGALSPDYGPFLHETGMPVLPKPFTIPQLRAVVARMVGPEILRRAETASVFLRENDRHAH